MTDSAKKMLSQYSLWIGLCALLISLGAGVHSCSSSIYGAGGTIATKADTSRVQALEVQMGKVQECLDGLKSRQVRLFSKVDKIDEKIDRILERVKK